MAERELYDLLYGPKEAVRSMLWPEGNCMTYDMAQRELYDLRYDSKEAV